MDEAEHRFLNLPTGQAAHPDVSHLLLLKGYMLDGEVVMSRVIFGTVAEPEISEDTETRRLGC